MFQKSPALMMKTTIMDVLRNIACLGNRSINAHECLVWVDSPWGLGPIWLIFFYFKGNIFWSFISERMKSVGIIWNF